MTPIRVGIGCRPCAVIAAALSVLACSSEQDSGECVSDAPRADGSPPCPVDRLCEEGRCVERLACSRPGADGCGGAPDPDLGAAEPFFRCEARVEPFSTSVECRPGVYTATSAVPAGSACDCAVDPNDPDAERLVCAVVAGASVDDAVPLYVLEDGGSFPGDLLGLPAEIESARRCVRPCSSEASCPGGHTCRPAAVVRGTPAGPDARGTPIGARDTIGVCYPNRLGSTSTVPSEDFQPDPALCEASAECDAFGDGLTCQIQVVPVPDHPFAPIGDAWSDRRAMAGRCVRRGGLVSPGLGCTLDRPQACRSGVCFSSRCAALCSPRGPNTGCSCRPFPIDRQTPSGVVSDIVHLCAP